MLFVYIQRAIQLFSNIKYPHVDLSLKLKPNENVLIHFHLVGMFLFCIDVNFQVSFKASNHIAVLLIRGATLTNKRATASFQSIYYFSSFHHSINVVISI